MLTERAQDGCFRQAREREGSGYCPKKNARLLIRSLALKSEKSETRIETNKCIFYLDRCSSNLELSTGMRTRFRCTREIKIQVHITFRRVSS